MSQPILHVSKTADLAVLELAEFFIRTAKETIAKTGRFSVALSGGSSPKKLYELLASPEFSSQLDWDKVDFFFGDERYVPSDDPDSNALMVKKALFDPLHIPAKNIFTVDTSLPPDEAALKYTQAIQHRYQAEQVRFDLVLLGLGDNSHTASLFPHTPVLHDTSVSVKAVFLEEQNVYRITMTAPLINLAHHLAFLVYGKGKAEAVDAVLNGAEDIENHPAQLIRAAEGEVHWFLDEPAASVLSV
ncbi:6-phosphogluconolactonase [Larkinella punicea]|uniref:6-phosphogluconolactonase n=1 Tax=Larkinella punicea TaxID=2315727 RepID=A0A368JPZ3_9BACT|nr:6-phosphogluconolactonase [Larkinella punicea]RCR69066.1 6-phosphogluconolactonase [Larkinella punicea]